MSYYFAWNDFFFFLHLHWKQNWVEQAEMGFSPSSAINKLCKSVSVSEPQVPICKWGQILLIPSTHSVYGIKIIRHLLNHVLHLLEKLWTEYPHWPGSVLIRYFPFRISGPSAVCIRCSYNSSIPFLQGMIGFLGAVTLLLWLKM